MTGLSSCIADLVRQRATIAPNDLAVRSGDEHLSYRELDIRSDRLANYLLGLGVLRGSIVGLLLDRGLEFPVAALAVLKLGAAYLPLEPKAPARRLETMLKSAQVSVLVTNTEPANLPVENVRKLVALDCCRKEIDGCSAEAPNVEVSPEDTAYVIFTSGSTGIPKAVAVGHASLLNLTRWHIRAFDVKSTDRATQLASIGFDAAVWELWPNLAAGASVHLVDDETRTDAERLRDWLVRENYDQFRSDANGGTDAEAVVAERNSFTRFADRSGCVAFLPAGRSTVYFGEQLRTDRVHGGCHFDVYSCAGE